MHIQRVFSQTFPNLLTIAGSDSGAGAGVQADLKTAAALGGYAKTAITAITAQNTQGILEVQVLEPKLVKAQIQAALVDGGWQAAKVGMLGTAAVTQVVAEMLAQAAQQGMQAPVVLDPVLRASSGSALANGSDLPEVMLQYLLPYVDVWTPNLSEAEILLGQRVATQAEMALAAKALVQKGAKAVLLKGGHLPGQQVADVLVQQGTDQVLWWEEARIDTPNTHGTGCTLSTALAVYLAKGETLPVAVEKARQYVRQALEAGKKLQAGLGNGPLQHFV